MLKEKNKVRKDQIPGLFSPYQIQSEIDRLYAILRTVQVLLRSKGIKVWEIFGNTQA